MNANLVVHRSIVTDVTEAIHHRIAELNADIDTFQDDAASLPPEWLKSVTTNLKERISRLTELAEDLERNS